MYTVLFKDYIYKNRNNNESKDTNQKKMEYKKV